MELEADPKDTASLKLLAQACEKHLQKLSQDEEAQEDTAKAREGYWASRQFAEFNLWCAKVGVNGEGLRSIDVRLKDVPEICELLRHLLQSLERDINELQQPAEVPAQISNADNNLDDVESDASSLSFKSLSSSEGPKGQSVTGDVVSPWKKRNLALRRHIGDTIDRLHGHARQIERAGAKHRRERVEVYREKEGPKWVYEGFKKLATWKANEEFNLASDTIRQRIAESFARRRIRFDYLKEHQKKRAVDTGAQEQNSPPEPQLKGGDGPEPLVRKQEAQERANVPVRHRLQDQYTIYSTTENTILDLRPEPRRQERAESVVSVALRHPGFPPPPKTCGGSFQCPYCRLEFHAREAERDRWSQHVMQDFEPYFCTFEDCKAPFDVPNTFDGLLGHLQDHLPVQYHVDMPDGEHKEFDETEFEEHVKRYGETSEEMLATVKEASRRKGAFLFESCSFCGGYPDVLEERLPDPDTPEAQTELRKHIKQHMQDIALFLPPYREDIFNEDDDLGGSAITRRPSVNQDNPGEPGECKTVCNRQDCDCKVKGKYAAEDALAAESIAETELSTLARDPEAEEDADSWPELFGDSPLYDRSSVSDDYYLSDERLQPFIARLEPAPSSDRRKETTIRAKTTESNPTPKGTTATAKTTESRPTSKETTVAAKATVSSPPRKIPTEESSSPCFIAVMGQTGTGKTSFINLVTGKNLRVGHGLESCTRDVEEAETRIDGRIVKFIDTPSFNDSSRSDVEILEIIGHYLREIYNANTFLTGVIYLQRISDNLRASAAESLSLLKHLCGPDYFSNIVLVTTMWNQVTRKEGEARERELMTLWGALIEQGAIIHRHDKGRDSAIEIARHLLRKRPNILQFQTELAMYGIIGRTSAGQALTAHLMN